MQRYLLSAVAMSTALLAAASGSQAWACGIQAADVPPGTALEMTTASSHDHPWLRISHPAIVATRLLSGPCHGHLVRTTPLGFRYTAKPGFSGNDGYSFLACTATGQCIPSGAVITVTP